MEKVKKKQKRLTKGLLVISGIVAFLASLFQILDVNLPSLVARFSNPKETVSSPKTEPPIEAIVNPYVTVIKKNNSFIELDGYFPNDKMEKIIEDDLQTQGFRVSDSKVSYARGQPEGYLSALSSSIPILSYFEDVEIRLTDLRVSISGKVDDWGNYYEVIDAFPEQLPEGYQSNLKSVLAPYPCQKQIDIILSRGGSIQFAYDKAEIRGTKSSFILKQMAERLRLCGAVRLKIIAHSGQEGADDYNLHLSQARADAIRDHLISLDVGSANIQSIGYGEKEGYSALGLEFVTR